jgi:DNA polymerase-3 subunit epsilon
MGNKIFFFDLETTGVNFWQHGIHQISGCIEIDGEIKERFNFKVQPNPAAKIDLKALEIGNVTPEQLATYPTMQEVYGEIIIMLSHYIDKYSKTDKMYLCGFNNASFDNPFLRAFFVQNNDQYFGSWFWSNPIDTFVMATIKLMDQRASMPDFKLKTVAKQLGIEVDETKLHDAEYDIRLTREVYYACR